MLRISFIICVADITFYFINCVADTKLFSFQFINPARSAPYFSVFSFQFSLYIF